MGFSTQGTLIIEAVEAASIHPSIAHVPFDSCIARLINGRHSRSLPFGAGRELENSALEHSPFQLRARPSGLSSLPAPESLPEMSPLATFRR